MALQRISLEEAVKLRPDLWRTCYPRIYQEPRNGHYYSPKLVAKQLLQIALKLENGHRGAAEMYEFQIASHIARFRVPTFFIAPAMMQAMTNTATPSDIPWLTMRMPFEAGAFMLPKGTLKHNVEGDVLWIGYARFEVGEMLKKFREHRGTFVDSMATMVELPDRAALVRHCQDLLAPFGFTFDRDQLHVSFYSPDRRVDWEENWIILIDGYGPIGYIDGLHDAHK
jgi:hypothetical protein